MKTLLAVAVLLFTLGLGRSHALDTKSIETDWDWNIAQQVCTGATTCVFDVAGLGAGMSMSTMNVVGFKFSILPINSTATFTVSQVYRSYPNRPTTPTTGSNYDLPLSGFNDSGHPTTWTGTAPTISTSAAVIVYPGQGQRDAYLGTFEALTVNPYFSLSGLTTTGTTYITVEYGTKSNVH